MNHALILLFMGAVGVFSRWRLDLYLKSFGWGFGLEIALINGLGCLGMGFMYAMLKESSVDHQALISCVMIGFLGGFTTFSSFALDVFKLLESGQIGPAVLLYLCSPLICMIALFAGIFLKRFAFI